MHGGGDALHVLVVEHPVHARVHAAELAGVDEQHLAAPVAAVAALVLGQEPQAGRNLRVEEELRRQRHHHLDHVGLDHRAADLALAVLVGRHAAVGQHHAGLTARAQVVQDVLQPAVVGIARRWRAVHPARIIQQPLAAPVADVEGRVGQHVVGLQVRVLVAVEGIGRLLAQVAVHAADGQVHRHQPPGGRVGLLPVDGDVAELAAVALDELLALHEHAARAAARVVDLALVRCQHLDQHLHDRGRRVVLPCPLAFRQGELAQEVLVDLAQHIAGVLPGAKADGRDQVDQLAQLAGLQLGAAETLVQDALQARVVGLDGVQRHVDAGANVELLGVGADRLPACRPRHPEAVDHRVVVALLGGIRPVIGVRQIEVVGFVGERKRQLVAALVEGVADVLQEDQAEHDVLVLGRIHRRAQLVGRRPEGFLEVLVHSVTGESARRRAGSFVPAGRLQIPQKHQGVSTTPR